MITGPRCGRPGRCSASTSAQLAQRCGLSLPTIQRMEASDGVVRGNVDSLMKLVDALAADGIELIGEGAASSSGGRGCGSRRPRHDGRLRALWRGGAARLGADCDRPRRARRAATSIVYGASLIITLASA